VIPERKMISAADFFGRLALAAILTTCFCVPLGLALLRITGVPPTYPPLLPQQVVSGTIGGSILVGIGYVVLSAIIRDKTLLNWLFIGLGLVLLIASYYLPYRLTYTQSPRFAGVTFSAQIGQALLHSMVVVLSMICFLSEDSGWG
jgi:hypothetical protein